MKKVDVINCADPEDLARRVAGRWLEQITVGQSQFVALSGGRITLKLFAAVIELSRRQAVSLADVHFFWADERCVPPTDPESSYGVAQAAFFTPLGIAPERIHRVRGEAPPDRAAALAVAEIKAIVPLNSAGQPVFDLILLGLGEDGHVASLFPRETELERMDPAICRAIYNSPKPPPERVTLGYRTLAAARQVWVLVSGAGKEPALAASLRPDGRTALARVIELRGQTTIFTDVCAA
jgi:6-phosphogluconolactonase